MKRKIVTTVLGVVAAVAAALVLGVPGARPRAAPGSPAPAQEVLDDGVVAFYFHGNFRCRTCRTIEAYAEEAVTGGFADQMTAGALAWHVVNVEEPGDHHFIEDFRLVTKSVVVAEYRGGEVVRWKNLDKVWQLVGDKDRFVSYVQSELSAFLEEG